MKKTGTFPFLHDGVEYHFHYTEVKPEKKQTNKFIYLGMFQDKAPAGLECNTAYCLKHFLLIEDPASEEYAQCREAYDLMDYTGDHLRRILFRNDTAEAVCRLLREGKALIEPYKDCITVEPCYRDLEEYFQHCGNFPTLTRLNIVLQFAKGLRELTRNTLGKHRIAAHRDVKWENGGNDAPEGAPPNIRLLDFASVYLVSEAAPGATVSKRRGTLKFPLSAENTAVDSLLPGYKVSEYTDVNALGMLLASLFMTANGQYRNPNELWLSNIDCGEDGVDALNSSWRKAFEAVQDPDEPRDTTWIEEAIKQQVDKDGNKFTLAWESDPTPPQVLQQIRALFRTATRKAPENRCSLAAFIESLERIIATVRNPDKKFPVSIFLLNRADCNRHKAVYQVAAQKALLTLSRNGEKQGLPPHHVLCIGYGDLEGGSFDRDILPLSDTPVRTQQLAECIRALTPANSTPRDCMLYGIYKAYQILSGLRDRFYFDGQVFLFTPQVPDDRCIEPFPSRETGYDRQTLFAKLEEGLDCDGISFHAYTLIKPDENSWCTEYTVLRHRSKSIKSNDEASAEPHSGEAPVFQTDKNAPRVKLPGGRSAYCAIILKKQ